MKNKTKQKTKRVAIVRLWMEIDCPYVDPKADSLKCKYDRKTCIAGYKYRASSWRGVRWSEGDGRVPRPCCKEATYRYYAGYEDEGRPGVLLYEIAGWKETKA